VAALCIHSTVFYADAIGRVCRAYLHTPVSSSSTVSTPAPTLHHSICESDLSKPIPPSRSNSLVFSQPSKDIRDVHKHISTPLPPSRSNSLVLSQPLKDIRDVYKYCMSLVSSVSEQLHFPTPRHMRLFWQLLIRSLLPDAAVRSLFEIWNPHDIPADFST
jgi:hypothetical protein